MYDQDEFLQAVQQFSHLKVIKDHSLWTDIVDFDVPNEDQQILVNRRLLDLASRCPNLTHVTHPQRMEYDVSIKRERDEVSFEDRKRQAWYAHGYSEV